MNWTSAQHNYGDGAAYRAYREAYFDAQDRAIAAQCGVSTFTIRSPSVPVVLEC